MQGHELKALREAMGLRQAGLAEALGLTATFIGLMERGVKPIEDRTALAVRYLFEHPEDRPEIEFEDMENDNPAEWLDQYRSLVDGKEWGPWRLSADTLTLDFQSKIVVVDRDEHGQDVLKRRERYYVPLPDIGTAESALDWIGQIARKRWGPAALGHFVQALDDIFHFQGRLCHGGKIGNADKVRAYLKERIQANI